MGKKRTFIFVITVAIVIIYSLYNLIYKSFDVSRAYGSHKDYMPFQPLKVASPADKLIKLVVNKYIYGFTLHMDIATKITRYYKLLRGVLGDKKLEQSMLKKSVFTRFMYEKWLADDLLTYLKKNTDNQSLKMLGSFYQAIGVNRSYYYNTSALLRQIGKGEAFDIISKDNGNSAYNYAELTGYLQEIGERYNVSFNSLIIKDRNIKLSDDDHKKLIGYLEDLISADNNLLNQFRDTYKTYNILMGINKYNDSPLGKVFRYQAIKELFSNLWC